MRMLPSGWREVPLASVAEVRLGRQRSPKNHAGEQMRPYVRAANVGWSGLRLDDVKSMNFSDSELSVYRLEPGICYSEKRRAALAKLESRRSGEERSKTAPFRTH